MNSAQATRFIATLFISLSLSAPAHAVAVRLIPNLTSIAFHERTGGVAPNPFTYSVNSPQLTLASSCPATIPTQSEWGQIALIAAIAAMAWFATRPRAAG